MSYGRMNGMVNQPHLEFAWEITAFMCNEANVVKLTIEQFSVKICVLVLSTCKVWLLECFEYSWQHSITSFESLLTTLHTVRQLMCLKLLIGT